MASTEPTDLVTVDPAASLNAQRPEAIGAAPSDRKPGCENEASAPEASPSALEHIVDSLVDHDSLKSMRQSQRETLASLQKASQELNQLTRMSASTYAEYAKEFTVAARVARVIRRDLGIASYRLEALKAKLKRVEERKKHMEAAAKNASTVEDATSQELGVNAASADGMKKSAGQHAPD